MMMMMMKVVWYSEFICLLFCWQKYAKKLQAGLAEIFRTTRFGLA